MENLICQLIKINQSCCDNQSVKENMRPFLDKLEKMYWTEATQYFNKREQYNQRLLNLAKDIKQMLEKLFQSYQINAEIVPTASLNSGLNLIHDSDIDITILVDDCTSVFQEVETILLPVGFQYKGLTHGYYLFSHIHSAFVTVELEVKLRDRCSAQAVIRLHRLMDNLDEKDKIIITYGKLLFRQTPYYGIFKMLVYNMYFADIEGCYMLKV